MQLRDVKVGQRVRVWIQVNQTGKVYVVPDRAASASSGVATSLTCTVVEQDPDNNTTVIGWKAGEPHADPVLNNERALTRMLQILGIVQAHEYGHHVECELEEDEVPPTKKNYGSQCPCGIHPSRCDYHRPS